MQISDTTAGGTGLLAIFCDLDAADQADFRPWLAEEMFPARLAIGFEACASYDRVSGEGREFLTLYAMPSLGHLYGAPYQALRQNRSARDAAYHEKFRNPERYTLSWTGPGLEGPAEHGLGAFVHVDRFDLAETETQAFNMHFVAVYLPALAGLSGITRVRRYLAMEGQPAQFVLHELADAAVVDGAAWREARGFPEATRSGLYRRVLEAQRP